MFKTVRSRFYATLLLVVVVLLVVGSGGTAALLRGYQDDVSESEVEAVATSLTPLIESALADSALGLGGLFRREARAIGGAVAEDTFVAVTNERGRVLAANDALPELQQESFEVPRLPPGASSTAAMERGRRDYVYSATRLESGAGGALQPAYLIVAQERQSFGEAMRELGPRLLFAALLATGVAAVVGLFLTRSITRPIGEVSKGARVLAEGDYSHRVEADGPQETRDLAASFNLMASEVESSQGAMRDFLANVSHELRTPLTSIRGFSQALTDGAIDDPQGVKRSAQVINQESARLLRLVEELLDLSRIESGQAEMRLAAVDLGEILAHMAEVFGLRAEEEGVSLQVEAPQGLRVSADVDRLEQVLSNLLDNAFKHTPRGAAIKLAAQAVQGGARILVTDSGSGIPAEDLPRLFDRFYRTASSAQIAGTGLGLTISREIARAHGGDITVTSAPGETTCTLSLPSDGRRSPPSAAR